MSLFIRPASGDGPRSFLIAGLLALLAGLPCPVRAEPEPVFVMATGQSETSYEGKWQRLAYQEAFRRLGVPLEVELMPTQRMTAMVDSGAVDGQFGRVLAYADTHPEQVRVDEPMYEIGFALWASNPALTLARVQDLATTSWIGVYRRGVELCQNALLPWVAADRLTSVATEHDALRMLVTGRVDYLCEIDAALVNAVHSPEFEGAAVRPLLTIGGRIAIYPYLSRKQAEMAPRLAAVLKAMKAEGLLERFQREALEK